MLYLKCKKKFRKDQIVTGNLLQYMGTPCPRTVTGFCRCFAFRIGKIRDRNGIIRNFQFRKFLPVKSNDASYIFITGMNRQNEKKLTG